MSKCAVDKCPICGQDLYIALQRYLFRELPGSNFNFQCKACGTFLEVEVQNIPEFHCHFIKEKVEVKNG